MTVDLRREVAVALLRILMGERLPVEKTSIEIGHPLHPRTTGSTLPDHSLRPTGT